MSMASSLGYDAYSSDDIRAWRNRQNYPKNEQGIRQCKNCGSTNIRISYAENMYCGELCWVKLVHGALKLKENK